MGHRTEGSMDGFEEAFDSATRVADAALKANQRLARQLLRLRKASQDGNVTAVKREQSRLAPRPWME